MSMDEDRDGFAAEYALGTLDAEERAQADALMIVDQDFAAKVRQWERRLGELEEDRRRMVLLAYYSGVSREQLAVQFDAPANTIKTWLRRSLMQIRECLGS